MPPFFKTALAWGAFCLLSLLIGYLPYRIGIRRLRYLEILMVGFQDALKSRQLA